MRGVILGILIVALSQLTLTSAIWKIGVVSNYPATVCSGSSFGGFEVEFFKNSMSLINKFENSEYELICITSQDVLNQIANGSFLSSSYVGVMGAYDINSTYQDLGYDFSQPTISNGLSLVQKQKSFPNLIVKSFTWSAIIALFCTLFLISIMLFNFETKNMFYNDYVFHSFASFFNIRDYRLQGLPGRAIQVSLWFFGLVLMCYFYANLVLVIREQRRYNIADFDQVVAANISSSSVYEAKIYELNAFYYSIDWPSSAQEIGAYIKDNDIELSMFPTYLADFITYSNCGLSSVLRGLTQLKYGLLFTAGADATIQRDINRGILLGQLTKNSEIFLQEMLSESVSQCSDDLDYSRDLQITFFDQYRSFLLIIGAILIALIWRYLKKNLRGKFTNIFFLFETNWIRRRRDLYTSKRLRKQWGKGMSEVLLNINKERSFRQKGVNMLQQFIRFEKKYDQERIKEAFDEIYDPEDENNFKNLIKKFNQGNFKLPYQQPNQNAQLQMQQSIIMQKNVKQSMMQSEMIPLEDMGRITPLIEYFTQQVAPLIQKKKPKQGLGGGVDPQQMYSDFKRKQRENKNQLNPEGSRLFKEILMESPDKQKDISGRGSADKNNQSTENMINNRFNLNLLNMRKDYEKFIPKKDGSNQNSELNNSRQKGLSNAKPSNLKSKENSGNKEDVVPPSSKRGFLNDSDTKRDANTSRLAPDGQRILNFRGYQEQTKNNQDDDDEFQMKEFNFRTDHSEKPLKPQTKIQSQDVEDYGSVKKAAPQLSKIEQLKQKYLQEKKQNQNQNQNQSYQNSSLDNSRQKFRETGIDDIEIFKNQVGKLGIDELKKPQPKPNNFLEPIQKQEAQFKRQEQPPQKQNTKKFDLGSDDETNKKNTNFDESLRQSRNNFLGQPLNKAPPLQKQPTNNNNNFFEKKKLDIIDLSDDDDSILGSPKNSNSHPQNQNQNQNQNQKTPIQKQNTFLTSNTKAINNGNGNGKSNDKSKNKNDDIDIISLESESDF